ncbi:MAG: hypothetical protein WD200_01200 [Candidatus Andersenbacteria bacterium]
MAQSFERTPQERETLIFSQPEQAQEFSERVAERITTPTGQRSKKESLAQELAEEFDRQGEGVGKVLHPWEHTAEEHQEVQQLVNVAFEKDLPAALKLARSSNHYPRNIDLLHDVLTTEMYELVRESHLNHQPTGVVWLVTAVLILLAGVGVILFIFIS